MKDDEFAEFDLTEDEIDAMMAAGTPVEIVTLSALAPSTEPYVLVAASSTYASTGSVCYLTGSVSTFGGLVQTANVAV